MRTAPRRNHLHLSVDAAPGRGTELTYVTPPVDMDGDGHPELIVTHAGFDTLTHYIGAADGPRPS